MTAFESHFNQAIALGRKSSEARHHGDEALASENYRTLAKIAGLYDRDDARKIRSAYDNAYRAASSERPGWDAGRW
jgi:hypothetical protein